VAGKSCEGPGNPILYLPVVLYQSQLGSAKGPDTEGPVELIIEGARKIRHTLRTSHTEATEPMRHVAIDGTAREKLRELSTVDAAGSHTKATGSRASHADQSDIGWQFCSCSLTRPLEVL
jgi:hypothetical protein